MAKTPNGKVVVALHGSASSGAHWQRVIEHFDNSNLILTPDLPGYGTAQVSTFNDVATRLEPIVQAIKGVGRPVHLIGHSFGGTCAMQIASQMPELVCQLSLYEPILLPRITSEQPCLNHPLLNLRRQMATASPSKAIERFYDFWGFPFPEHLSTLRREQMLQQVLNDFNNAIEISGQLKRGQFMNPVRLVHGERSAKVALTMNNAAKWVLPQAEIVCVPGGTHLAPFTLPQKVLPLLQERLLEQSHCDAVQSNRPRFQKGFENAQ